MRTRRLLNRFLPYYGKYKGILLFNLFCATLATLGGLMSPLMLRYITNQGMQDLAATTVGIVVRIGGLYLVLRIIDSFAVYYMAYTGHVMGVYIEIDMCQGAFECLQRLSDSYYGSTKVGQIMSRITSDLSDVTEFAHHCPEELFIAALKTVVSFIILSGIGLELTLLIFVLIPVMVVSCIWFNMKIKEAFRRQRNQIGELDAQIEDALLGNRVVRAFANEPAEIAKFGKGSQALMDIKRYTYRYVAAFQITTRFFDGLVYVVVIATGGIFMVQGKIEAGDPVAYTLYVATLLTTTRRIIEFVEQFQCGMTGIERFQEIMDVMPDIGDCRNAKMLEHVKGKIVFNHVSFFYPGGHAPVPQDTDLTVEPGERIALVRSSGGGKTTLCNLLPRFYGAAPGSITVNDQDIRGVTLRSLRSNIGVVQQGVYLFSGSVYENISYGRPGASRERVIETVRMVGVHESISELQDGYDTYVGERGVELSGGQKQRISIARVFLKNLVILILDEVTSVLDNESEFLVSQSLEKLAKGRTTFTIAHRLTTTRGADGILVLSGSRVVEEENYEALPQKKGMYYQLYNMANRSNQGIA